MGEQGNRLKDAANIALNEAKQAIKAAIKPAIPYIIAFGVVLIIIICIAGMFITVEAERVEDGDAAFMQSASTDAWEQFMRYLSKLEGGVQIFTNDKGEECYKVTSDGAGGYAVIGLDMRYYGDYFSGLGYGTSEGSLIPKDIAIAKRQDAVLNQFYNPIVKAFSDEGITLTGYQKFAVASRAFNCGVAGARYYGSEELVSAYKKYWQQSTDDKYLNSQTPDFKHKLYKKSMIDPVTADGIYLPGLENRRKSEWTLFQCGYYTYLNEWYLGDNSSSGTSGIMDSAKKIHDYIRNNNYQYCDWGSTCGSHSNGCGLNDTLEQSKSGYHNVCCATYVSWVLRDCGIIKETNHGSPDLANLLESTYKFKRIDGADNFQAGDILVSESNGISKGHIEIYAGDNKIYNAGYQGAINTENPYTKTDWSLVEYALRAPSSAGKEGTETASGISVKTYTTGQGKKYLLYKQTEGPWSTLSYASGGKVFGTVAEVGCPTTACATAVSAFNQGKNLTPTDFRDAIYSTTIRGALEKLGFSVTYHSGFDKNTVISQLKKGYPVIYRVTSASIFTNNQHWMALIDINSDGSKVYVASGSSASAAGWYDVNTAFNAANEYFTFDTIN